VTQIYPIEVFWSDDKTQVWIANVRICILVPVMEKPHKPRSEEVEVAVEACWIRQRNKALRSRSRRRDPFGPN